MAVTIESIETRMSRLLQERFGDVQIMPRSSTCVRYQVPVGERRGFIDFSDSYIAACANQGRAMTADDEDLKNAFDMITMATGAGKRVEVYATGEATEVDL